MRLYERTRLFTVPDKQHKSVFRIAFLSLREEEALDRLHRHHFLSTARESVSKPARCQIRSAFDNAPERVWKRNEICFGPIVIRSVNKQHQIALVRRKCEIGTRERAKMHWLRTDLIISAWVFKNPPNLRNMSVSE